MSCTNNNIGTDNSGNRNSGDCNSGNRNSGDCNSGYYNSGNRNSGNRNSGDRNSGDRNSGNRNSGHCNSGDYNSGDYNSGHYNSGDYNSGVFNTIEPNAMFFNKPTTIKLSTFINSDKWPDFSGVQPCVWIDESIMTDKEKEAYPTYKTTGGYLKTLEYKEAWAVFWRKTSDDNKRKIFALPNFDAAIFKEITGIDVNGDGEAKQKAKELREQADKLLLKAKELESSL